MSADQQASAEALGKLQAAKDELAEQHSALLTDSELVQSKLTAQLVELTAQHSELTGQQATLTEQMQQLQQKQSSEALELNARNAGLVTQLNIAQQHHAEAISRVTAEVAQPMEQQTVKLKQQLKASAHKLYSSEQQLRAHEVGAADAESRAARAEALLKKTEERRAGSESDKRHLQTSLREAKAEVRTAHCASVTLSSEHMEQAICPSAVLSFQLWA